MGGARVSCPAGAVVFREGDPPTCAYVIEAGAVAISAERNGGSVELAVLGPGDLLGEMAVIDDAPRTATATAATECVLLEIDRAAIAERLSQADPIIRSLLEGQLKRYRRALAAMQGKTDAAPSAVSAVERASIDKFRLESQLREALANGGLDIRLQPLLDVRENAIAGYEALVRWTHPDRGPISPVEFIALAEETSLINPVGEYVLDSAIAALDRMQRHRAGRLPFIAINVSPRQLMETTLIQRIVERTRIAGFAPDRIKVEITESRMVDYPTVKSLIARCHDVGIKVAMDDFGTGFSNLGHLHELPFDTVKVDQVFARTMMESERAMSITRSIISMIHALGADVVVEGVESVQQLNVLREIGCRYVQGYLVGRPQPLADVLAGSDL